MPMLTTLRMRLPVWPVHAPERTRVGERAPSGRAPRGPRRRRPSPSTTSDASRGSRSATCSTARSSVTLMCSPRNIASMRSRRPARSASATQQPHRLVGDAVLRVVEVQAGGLAASGARRAPGPRANSSRRWTSPRSRVVRLERPHSGSPRSRRSSSPASPGGRRTACAWRTGRLLANSASPRELKRENSALASTWHGHALVDGRLRPSSGPRPSRTRGRRTCSVGLLDAAPARSGRAARSDHAAAAPDLGDLGEVDVVLVALGWRSGVVSASASCSCSPDVGVLQDVQALGVGGHEAVLDAVVDHLHEVAGAVRAAVQVALLGGARSPLAARRARRASTPGASAAKIGSRRATASSSPPIIRQ